MIRYGHNCFDPPDKITKFDFVKFQSRNRNDTEMTKKFSSFVKQIFIIILILLLLLLTIGIILFFICRKSAEPGNPEIPDDKYIEKIKPWREFLYRKVHIFSVKLGATIARKRNAIDSGMARS